MSCNFILDCIIMLLIFTQTACAMQELKSNGQDEEIPFVTDCDYQRFFCDVSKVRMVFKLAFVLTKPMQTMTELSNLCVQECVLYHHGISPDSASKSQPVSDIVLTLASGMGAARLHTEILSFQCGTSSHLQITYQSHVFPSWTSHQSLKRKRQIKKIEIHQ